MTAFQLEAGPGAHALHATPALDHPFYFDHPLTHLPGLLLLDVALAALERAAPAEAGKHAWFTRFEAAFVAISALNLPLQVQVSTTGSAGEYRCTLAQNGKMRATVTAELALVDAKQARRAAVNARPTRVAIPFMPLEQLLVRKSRPENVLLGRRDDEILRPIRAPEEAACALGAERGGCYSPVYLTECFLQLCRASRHEGSAPSGGGIPVSREILVLVGGRLLRPVAASEVLEIGFWPEPETSRTPRHPHAMRRSARIFQCSEVVAQLFCDAVKL